MKRILVTGGSGFIGSHTCYSLLENNYDLFVIDSLVNSDIKSIARIKKIFMNKNIDISEVDAPHVDIDNFRHFVVLYYVCDSDGDTIIYNEKEYGLKKYTERQRVSPKQGRCVIFDGTQMHTAEQPINSNIRCVVNYNLN